VHRDLHPLERFIEHLSETFNLQVVFRHFDQPETNVADVMSGLYSYLSAGLRSFKTLENIK
jgi:hypothetical protein